jgi:hypothetical protein
MFLIRIVKVPSIVLGIDVADAGLAARFQGVVEPAPVAGRAFAGVAGHVVEEFPVRPFIAGPVRSGPTSEPTDLPPREGEVIAGLTRAGRDGAEARAAGWAPAWSGARAGAEGMRLAPLAVIRVGWGRGAGAAGGADGCGGAEEVAEPVEWRGSAQAGDGRGRWVGQGRYLPGRRADPGVGLAGASGLARAGGLPSRRADPSGGGDGGCGMSGPGPEREAEYGRYRPVTVDKKQTAAAQWRVSSLAPEQVVGDAAGAGDDVEVEAVAQVVG